jgi:hypothetical protein
MKAQHETLRMKELTLRPQEIPLDDPRSCCMFQPSPEKPGLGDIPQAIEVLRLSLNYVAGQEAEVS